MISLTVSADWALYLFYLQPFKVYPENFFLLCCLVYPLSHPFNIDPEYFSTLLSIFSPTQLIFLTGGCCWAFGSTEAFNDRFCISHNSTKLFSPQDTCSCCNSDNGCSSGGCDGGFTEDAFNYFLAHGVVSGGDYPDIGKGDSCFPYQLKACAHHEASPLVPCPQVCSPGECTTPQCPSACSEKSYATAWKNDKTKGSKGAYRLDTVAKAQADIMK